MKSWHNSLITGAGFIQQSYVVGWMPILQRCTLSSMNSDEIMANKAVEKQKEGEGEKVYRSLLAAFLAKF